MSRRVLIAFAPAGGGHGSLAQAIVEALACANPQAEVCVLDFFSSRCSSFPLTAFPSLYGLVSARLPTLWRWFYAFTNRPTPYALIERTGQPLIRPKLRQILDEYRPERIVCVNPIIGPTLRQACVDLGLHLPIGVVVGDLRCFHRAWLLPQASWYAVPTDEARAWFTSAGIEASRIHAFGLPLRHAFSNPPADRTALRVLLDSTENQTIVLVSCCGIAPGHARKIVGAITAAGSAIYPVVITGRNERLRGQLIRDTEGATARILGYAHNMADWMWAADLLVTKAGPTVICEAIQCGLPMVIAGAIPGQEEGNVSFVVENGLGVQATEPGRVAAECFRLLGEPAVTAAMRVAMQRLRRPEAAQRIAELILSDESGPSQYPA